MSKAHASIFMLCPSMIAVAILIGCQSVTTPGKNAETERANRVSLEVQDDQARKQTSTVEKELIILAKDFATSESRRRELAWKSLTSHPRDNLVRSLTQLRDSSVANDSERIAIAFLLCNLDFDYDENKSLIVAALSREPHHKNPYSDWEAELVHRLIVRGDSHLLPTLFETTAWSDGAMAASLSGYLTYHMRNRPEQFLLELKPQREEIRQDVYARLMMDEFLTKKDLASIKRYLKSVPKTSPTFDVAQEMLSTLRKHQ